MSADFFLFLNACIALDGCEWSEGRLIRNDPLLPIDLKRNAPKKIAIVAAAEFWP